MQVRTDGKALVGRKDVVVALIQQSTESLASGRSSSAGLRGGRLDRVTGSIAGSRTVSLGSRRLTDGRKASLRAGHGALLGLRSQRLSAES